ncbi:ATP-binding protein [Candidatus Omnitrophota bacterium]
MSELTVIGHADVIDYFKKIAAKGRLAHAYLFIGKEGIGKRKTAWHISAFLNCEGKDKPCLSCPNCLKIAKHAHPDISEIAPTTSIGIEEIKEMRKRVHIKNFSSAYKIIIIDDADTLTHDAANAFLKTLEEPPPGVIFFLITAKPENILPTIKSRAHQIWFSLKLSESRKCLSGKKYADADLDFLLKLSDGRLSMIAKLVRPAYLSKRKDLFSGPALAFTLVDKDRKSLKDTMLLLLSFLRDCLLIKIGKESEVMNQDLQKKLIEYSRQFSVETLTGKIDQLFELNTTLDTININLANNIIRDVLQAK